MTPDVLALLIPIIAIGGGIGAGIVNKILKYNLRKLELEAMARSSGNDDLVRQIQGLRTELAHLRDTATSYDLTIDEQLQKLDRRVEFLETKQQRTTTSTQVKPEIVQQIGRSE